AEEMERARGVEKPAAEVSTQIDLDVNAYIPDSFVPDSVLKVEFYKRLAACESLAEIDDLAAELADRYGQLPAQVENMLDIGRIRVPARRLSVESIKQKPGGAVELKFADGHPVRGEHLLDLMTKWEKRLLFSDRKGFSIMVRSGDIRSDAGREGLILRILCELEKIVFDKEPVRENS
ncbi:transcription-repair coupling factor, partial [bacterium]|nr:transcription-repair coupling factor [bacterium]